MSSELSASAAESLSDLHVEGAGAEAEGGGDDGDDEDDKPRTIVLVGVTGEGKSSTANTLVLGGRGGGGGAGGGAPPPFAVSGGFSSATRECAHADYMRMPRPPRDAAAASPPPAEARRWSHVTARGVVRVRSDHITARADAPHRAPPPPLTARPTAAREGADVPPPPPAEPPTASLFWRVIDTVGLSDTDLPAAEAPTRDTACRIRMTHRHNSNRKPPRGDGTPSPSLVFVFVMPRSTTTRRKSPHRKTRAARVSRRARRRWPDCRPASQT